MMRTFRSSEQIQRLFERECATATRSVPRARGELATDLADARLGLAIRHAQSCYGSSEAERPVNAILHHWECRQEIASRHPRSRDPPSESAPPRNPRDLSLAFLTLARAKFRFLDDAHRESRVARSRDLNHDAELLRIVFYGHGRVGCSCHHSSASERTGPRRVPKLGAGGPELDRAVDVEHHHRSPARRLPAVAHSMNPASRNRGPLELVGEQASWGVDVPSSPGAIDTRRRPQRTVKVHAIASRDRRIGLHRARAIFAWVEGDLEFNVNSAPAIGAGFVPVPNFTRFAVPAYLDDARRSRWVASADATGWISEPPWPAGGLNIVIRNASFVLVTFDPNVLSTRMRGLSTCVSARAAVPRPVPEAVSPTPYTSSSVAGSLIVYADDESFAASRRPRRIARLR